MATVFRRGKNGIYYGKYSHRGKERRPCLDTTSKRIAEKRLMRLLTQHEEGIETSPSKTPVGAALTDFVQHLRSHHRKEAVNREIYRLREFFGPICPELTAIKRKTSKLGTGFKGRRDKPGSLAITVPNLEDVNTSFISDFIQEKRARHGIAPKTANEYREIIQRLFNWAIRERGVRMPVDPRRNPASDVKTFRVPAPEIHFLAVKDIWEQLRVLEPYPQMQTMVALFVFAGLRREEALWLTPKDIDLVTARIYVRAKTVGGEFWQPKTARNRVVPISKVLMPYFLDHELPNGVEWYFPSPQGCRWDPDNFSCTLRRINKAAGLAWSCQHYRHTFGSHLAMKGESLYKISAIMGNSPEICRRHYARLLDESLVDTVEFIDQIAPTKLISKVG